MILEKSLNSILTGATMMNNEKFYVFDVIFRDGRWKTWGLGAMLSGALMTSLPLYQHDDENNGAHKRTRSKAYQIPTISNVFHNRVDVLYFDAVKKDI